MMIAINAFFYLLDCLWYFYGPITNEVLDKNNKGEGDGH